MKYISDKQWINEQTRAIVVEFLVYNVNFNVFNSVTLVIEKTAAGTYEKSYAVSGYLECLLNTVS